MRYPIKTPSQLPLVLKGFRKARGLTQAAIAQRLGITQQSYAYFEANPASATLDRLFVVMRILGVEIVLDQADMPDVTRKALSATASNPVRVAPPVRKKEAW